MIDGSLTGGSKSLAAEPSPGPRESRSRGLKLEARELSVTPVETAKGCAFQGQPWEQGLGVGT